MNFKHLFITIVVIGITLPSLVLAQEFVPLVGIPGVDSSSKLSDYINQLYILSISIAAILVVIKLIVAGVKYMLSEVVTDKGDAKKDIKGALFGLLIVLGVALILETINPNLRSFAVFDNLQKLSNPCGDNGCSGSRGSGGSGTTGNGSGETTWGADHKAPTPNANETLTTFSCSKHDQITKSGCTNTMNHCKNLGGNSRSVARVPQNNPEGAVVDCFFNKTESGCSAGQAKNPKNGTCEDKTRTGCYSWQVYEPSNGCTDLP